MDFALIARVFETLRIPPPARLVLLESATLAGAHVPPYPLDLPVLVTTVDSNDSAAQLKKVLSTAYPSSHEVFLVEEASSTAVSIEAIDAQEFSAQVCFYVPPPIILQRINGSLCLTERAWTTGKWEIMLPRLP